MKASLLLGTLLSLVAGSALAQAAANSPTTSLSGQDYSLIEQGLQTGAEVQLQGQLRRLGMNPLDIPTFRNLYNEDTANGCREGSTGNVTRNYICMIVPPGVPIFADRGVYDYWEPAAIVEVSCQKGFSLLKPGFMGQGATVGGAPVQPGQCGVGPNWFFEVRVWASSPKRWGDRMTVMGGGFWEQTGGAMCSGQGTTGASKYPWGYGVKYNFTKGPESGPANSLEAYISDNDPTWSRQLTLGQATQQMQQAKRPPQNQPECRENNPDVPACWGDPSQQHGWVTHPNRAAAAALAGYRGLLKAQGMNRVATPIQGGWRMSMDYPFVKSPSSYAQGMGMQSQGRTRHRGSDCFVPGDGGPWWFTTGRKGQNPRALQAVTNPSATANADVGTYIFTYWVRTNCTVYSNQTGRCQDQFRF